MKMITLILAVFVSTTVLASGLQLSQDDVLIKSNEDYSSYNFGTVWTNSRSVVRFKLTNTGTTPLTFRDAVIYGADFGANHSCRNGLLPSQKCSFEIQYWPLFEGVHSGRFILNFVENDQVVVDLWGQARRM